MGKEDRGLAIVFGLLAVLCGLPLLAFEGVPGADLPSHLAILRHLADALENPEAFRAAMEMRPWQPYWGFYAPTLLLAQAMPLEMAARLVMFGALLCVPLAVLLIAGREGSDPRAALGAFPLVFGFNYYWGFLPFYASACLGLIGLLPVLRHDERGDGRSLLGVHATSLGLFAAHATAWALWAAWSLWIWVTGQSRSWRRPLTGLTAMVAPLALFWIWKASAGLEGITQPPATHGVVFKATHFAHHAFPGISPAWEIGIALAFLAVVGLGLAGRPLPEAKTSRRRLRWGGLAAFMLAAYWVLPQDLAELSFVYPRFLVFAGVFLLLSLPGRMRFPRTFLVLATVLALVSIGQAGIASARFSERSAGARECLAHARPGSILMYFPFQRDDPDLRYPLYLHAGAWHALWNRGRVFADWIEALPTAMVRWKDPAGMGPPPPVFLWAARPLDDPSVADPVEYFLVHGPRRVRPPNGEPVSLDVLLLAGVPVAREPVCESGRWRLYRRGDGRASAGSP